MTKPLSIDIRERLVSAVEGGMSRRSAAARFGVAASTAIKWVDQWRQTGHVRPRPQGGDKRSHRIEAHAVEVLGLIEETPDITLEELAGHLDEVHGLKVAPSTVWRLLDRRDMTFKKGSIRELYALVIECLERQEVGLWTARVSKCGFRRRAG